MKVLSIFPSRLNDTVSFLMHPTRQPLANIKSQLHQNAAPGNFKNQ